MKRFKRTVHRIRANASATRERLRGKLAAKRESNKVKVTASEVPASEVGVSEVSYGSVQAENGSLEVHGPGDSAIPHESDQVVDVVPTSKKASYMYSDSALFYISDHAGGAFVERLWLQFGTWESFENRFLADMRIYHPEITANRRSSCRLDWLPLEIRAKIWKYVFDDCKEAIILENDDFTPKIPSSMRLSSFEWMSETSIAYINALSNRTLVVKDFPKHGYLAPPCPIFRELMTNRIRAMKFALGDKDPKKARKRAYKFIEFMVKHRDEGFMAVRTVIVELRRNWENSFFSEWDLAYLLACGAFVSMERIRIHGHITEEKLNLVLERARILAHTPQVPKDLQIPKNPHIAEDWQIPEDSQVPEALF